MKCDCHPDCQEEATVTIWCPTWIRSADGPVHRSKSHASVFTEANPGAIGGAFYFGDDAERMFRQVEAIIPYTDDRYRNALGMLFNGHHLVGRPLEKNDEGSVYAKSGFHQSLHIVDGKLWLATRYLVVRLGDYSEAQEVWSKLIHQVVNR